MSETAARGNDGPGRARLRALPEEAPRLFGPGSFMWEDMGDTLFLAMTPGAFMLQAMHPVISAAVDRYSTFRTDPVGRAVRSADSMMLWVYGGQAAVEEGERLRVAHRPLHGTADDGTRFSALDPEAYAWVHATGYVTGVTIAPYVRGRRMTRAEEQQAFDEHLQLGELLRIPPREVPQTIPEYWDHYRTMVHDRLARTTVAEELVEQTEAPRVRIVPGPIDIPGRLAGLGAGRLLRLLTYGGMTPEARDVLGVRWSAVDEAQLSALFTVARPVHARLPERLRYLPLALHARRHARELEAIRGRARQTFAG